VEVLDCLQQLAGPPGVPVDRTAQQPLELGHAVGEDGQVVSLRELEDRLEYDDCALQLAIAHVRARAIDYERHSQPYERSTAGPDW
jgi:hypothetical protein